jgi:anaerobic ribonucleoside-triphosphate reductase activating protein
MSKLLLNVASTISRSRANGPGVRAVIWVQGCTIGCLGCYSSPTHPHTANVLVKPAELVDWILTVKNIEGITISGGEPFEQAAALLETIKALRREKPSMTVFIFSGYEYRELLMNKDSAVIELLQYCDMLSAGPFVTNLRDESLLWRGSSNQKLHYLTNAYDSSMEEKWILDSPSEEYSIHNDAIQFTGFGGKTSKVLRMVSDLIGTI